MIKQIKASELKVGMKQLVDGVLVEIEGISKSLWVRDFEWHLGISYKDMNVVQPLLDSFKVDDLVEIEEQP